MQCCKESIYSHVRDELCVFLLFEGEGRSKIFFSQVQGNYGNLSEEKIKLLDAVMAKWP